MTGIIQPDPHPPRPDPDPDPRPPRPEPDPTDPKPLLAAAKTWDGRRALFPALELRCLPAR